MKVKVIQSFKSASGFIPVGQILEISESMLQKLSGKVAIVERDNVTKCHSDKQPDTQTCYCKQGNCHCSGRLLERNHPTDCKRIRCESYHEP